MDKLLVYYTDLYPTELNHNQHTGQSQTIQTATFGRFSFFPSVFDPRLDRQTPTVIISLRVIISLTGGGKIVRRRRTAVGK
jgi:hypothetical protein